MTEDPSTTRNAVLFRPLDAKDEAGLRALWADDAQATDEITRGWVRGNEALDACLRDNLPRLTDIHSTFDQVAVHAWGEVEVETCVLHQQHLFDGARVEIEAPTTTIWRHEGSTWKLALMPSIPLPAAT